MVLIFLALEYIRPPGLVELKGQMLISLAFPVLWWMGPRPWSTILTWQTAMLAWCAKGVPIAWNYFAAYFVTRIMFAHVSMALALTAFCSDLRGLKRALWFWLVTIVYQAVWALTHDGKGSGGFMGDENDLALACVTLLPLAFLGFDMLSGLGRWLSGGALALLMAAAVASFSRGGFLGLVVGVGYSFLASKSKFKLAVFAGVAVLIAAALAPPGYMDEVRSIQKTDEGTALSRQFLWTAAFNMWKDRPLIGWGGGNTSFMVGAYQPRNWEGRQYQEMDWSGTAVHSSYFQLLPEQGLIGLGIFIFLIVYQLRRMRALRRSVQTLRYIPESLKRDARLYTYALNGMLLAYLTSAAFISAAYYPYLWYVTGFSAVFDSAIRREVKIRRLALATREAE
jgi:O-antigen ligase